ncbi:hypothetical protein AAY473_014682 [Plecturocebus cupreus]
MARCAFTGSCNPELLDGSTLIDNSKCNFFIYSTFFYQVVLQNINPGYPIQIKHFFRCQAIRSPLCRPGWSAVTRSGLTATSASWVQAILLPQPPEVSLCSPGWNVVAPPRLTATSTSWAQAILLPQPSDLSLRYQVPGWSAVARSQLTATSASRARIGRTSVTGEQAWAKAEVISDCSLASLAWLKVSKPLCSPRQARSAAVAGQEANRGPCAALTGRLGRKGAHELQLAASPLGLGSHGSKTSAPA